MSDLDDMAREIGASIGRGLDIMCRALLADGAPADDTDADRRTA